MIVLWADRSRGDKLMVLLMVLLTCHDGGTGDKIEFKFLPWRTEVTAYKKNQELPQPLEKFTRGLMATTCLTVACGASAVAGTITEGTPPAPNLFPTTSPGYLLPLGTTVVNGFAGVETGPAFFEFQGLTSGASYTLTGQTPNAENGLSLFFGPDTNIAQFALEIGEAGGNPLSQVFTAPSDGDVVVEVFQDFENGVQDFTVTLSQNSSGVPEPSTFAGVGMGLGALGLAWRRRRS